MSAFHSFATRAYCVASQPIRWIWSKSAKTANRYPLAVLFYHRVSDIFPNPWTISTADFQRQIDWLRKRYDIVTLSEIQNRIRTGNDRPTVAITFDDGYADNSFTAIPLLVKNQIPATYFVSSDYVLHDKPFPHDVAVGRPLHPNGIESLKLMAQSGIEIGAHSRTHCNLGEISDSETLIDEIVTARNELEEALEQPVRYFAFPFGQYENLNDEVFRIAKENGFRGVCSAYGGYNEVGGDEFHLQRIHGDPNFDRFQNWLTLDPRMAFRKKYAAPDVRNIKDERDRRNETRNDVGSRPTTQLKQLS